MSNARSSWTLALEKIFRTTTMWCKKLKRIFKNKELGDPFLKTVKMFSPRMNQYMEFKMRLDTGCEVHDMVTRQVVHDLRLSDNLISQTEPICVCLNGEQLMSSGKIVLRWKGKCFRKVFETIFYVIDGDILPWQVVLGAKTIHEHGILKFAGFGGFPILPKKMKEEQAQTAARKREHEEEVKANNAKVSADIKAKKVPAREAKSTSVSKSR